LKFSKISLFTKNRQKKPQISKNEGLLSFWSLVAICDEKLVIFDDF